MAQEQDITLVDTLRSTRAESPCIEFKENQQDPDLVGCTISALANSAAMEEQEVAYGLWGGRNGTHEVVGTTFDPLTQKKGNQAFLLWLRSMLAPSCAFDFREVDHPDGRLVLLEVPAASGAPLTFKKIAYIRVGSSVTTLVDDAQRYQKLTSRMQPYKWEMALVRPGLDSEDVTSYIDYSAFFKLTKQRLPDTRQGVIDRLEDAGLIAIHVI